MKATSKSFESSNEQSPFGYRGESLHSMRAICSQMTISSKVSPLDPTLIKTMDNNGNHNDDDTDQNPPIQSNANIVTSYARAEHPVGTIVHCRNIYGRQPVRKDILIQRMNQQQQQQQQYSSSSSTTTSAGINDVRLNVERVAMIHPMISFQLRSYGQTVCHIERALDRSTHETITSSYNNNHHNGDINSDNGWIHSLSHERLSVLIGRAKSQDMQSVCTEKDEQPRIDIVTSHPLRLHTYSTSTKCAQFVYLNKRYVPKESDVIRREMNTMYRSFCLRFRYYLTELNSQYRRESGGGTTIQSLVPNFVVLISYPSSMVNIADGAHRVQFIKSEEHIVSLLRSAMNKLFNQFHPLYAEQSPSSVKGLPVASTNSTTRGSASRSEQQQQLETHQQQATRTSAVSGSLDRAENCCCPTSDAPFIARSIKQSPMTIATTITATRKSIGELLSQSKRDHVTFGKLAERPIQTRLEMERKVCSVELPTETIVCIYAPMKTFSHYHSFNEC